MDLLEVMQNRRSVRRYTQERITEEKLEAIVQAGLLSPSSRSLYPWDCIVVRNKETLELLSRCRVGGAAKMLAGADCAIVVIADPNKADTWIEDSSIAMANMHLMADHVGVGSCWIQGRLRSAGEESTDAYVRRLLNYPESYELEAILSLGMPEAKPQPRPLQDLATERIHQEAF